ncbi:MAG TPA: hypothetical protein VNY05_05620 [Candidatus Acidoferrales bacterium]|jgi:hypothetical protein|nr:hypothetical protein [Candidatus Acidoferrales bacterium]
MQLIESIPLWGRALESVYESVLAYELEHGGLLTKRQQPVPWCITATTLTWDFEQT